MAFLLLLLIAILPKPIAAQTPSAKGLSETERSGLKLFLQRCSICHLGVPPKYQTYGSLLHKEVIAARGDQAVRKVILEGSQRMPGFQYVLNPTDVDNLISYLKAVPKEALTLVPSPGGSAEAESK
jgi:mono/diheme cytochrome c family protein